MGGLLSLFSSNDMPAIDCHSEDSFVVVGKSSSAVENRTSVSCTGSEESFVHLNLHESEELPTPVSANTPPNNDEIPGLPPIATSPLSPLDSREAVRTKIENVIRSHFTTLVKDMDPREVARYLYESGIIDSNQHEAATNPHVERVDRSDKLLQQLIRKLKSNPQWCGKTVAAMERAGVNVTAIVEDFRREGIPLEITAVHSQWGVITRFWMTLGLRERGIQDKDGNTPLHVVAARGDMSILERILHCNPPADIINCTNNDGQTALHVGVRNQSVAVTTRLCECRTCDPYVFDNEGRTALHYACKSTDLAKPLLKLCSNSRFIDATDKCGNTALHLATMDNFKDVMKLLRRSKADPRIKNHKQQTPIDIAREGGDKKVLKILKKWKYRHGISWPSIPHISSRMKKSFSSSEMSPSYASRESFNSQARSSVCSAYVIPETDDDSSDDDAFEQ